MSKVLVPLADGLEEIEAITIIDLLRRAEIDVVTASLTGDTVKGSHGIVITADTTLDVALNSDYDMVVLPGGMPGAEHLDQDKRVHALLHKMADSGKFTGAICAAPKVLANAGLLNGKKATSYPGFVDKMNLPGVTYTGAPVQCDGKIITGRGPGAAMDFTLSLIEALDGKEKRNSVEKALMR
ncbi:MAG: DJ-1 family glyoxalase III [Candidatus Hydrogenedentes bacterium]|nr:DJ-1 family glyoxalase III [Candidatus Hydrogenedentota bacterium]